MKHMLANNDYYHAEIQKRSKKRLSQMPATKAHDPKVVKNSIRESRMDIMSKVALDWLRTGELPSIDSDSK